MLKLLDVQFYKDEGYIGPLNLIHEKDIQPILAEYQGCLEKYPSLGPKKKNDAYTLEQYWRDLGENMPWFKSLHTLMPSVKKLATSANLVGALEAIIGPDIMLWGSQLILKLPGEIHNWHVDVETLVWDSVNVWVALENTSADATLQIISKTHTFEETPQSLKKKESMDLSKNSEILRRAKDKNAGASLVIPAPKAGQVIFFHGKTWHGSFNQSNLIRTSILLQYSTPSEKVKIPTSFEDPVQWHSYAPPCLMIKGRDAHRLNRYI